MSESFKQKQGLSAKLMAMKWFVDREYYVFDETNQGPIDFIAVNMDGDVQYIECKMISRRKDGSKISRVCSEKQNRLKSKGVPIQIMYVDAETNDVYFNTQKSSDPILAVE
tara:strand:+ start:65 stop:397 length:333 start_codon:yes stop_codon:yes gene_type:complete